MSGCVPGQRDDESPNLSPSLLSHGHQLVFNVSFLRCQEDVFNSAESHIVLDSGASAEHQGTGKTLSLRVRGGS